MAAISQYHIFRQPTTLQSSSKCHCLLLRISSAFHPSLSSLHKVPSLFICNNSLSPLTTASPTSKPNLVAENDDEDGDLDEFDEDGDLDEFDEDEDDSEYGDELDEDEKVEEEKIVVEDKESEKKVKKETSSVSVKRVTATGEKPPSLSIKERKELVSYAHGLGDKLKSQLVGKSGVTDSVAAAFVENLESNELLKIKIHRTCPGELPDVVKHLEEATGSVVIGQVGRTVILYRPSLAKLRAEEKKLQNRRVFMRKSTLKPVLPSRKNTRIAPEPGTRLSQRGRRGSSRERD